MTGLSEPGAAMLGLTGTITGPDGAPIAGASIRAIFGGTNRQTLTNASGHYDFLLPVAEYEVTATAFGFVERTAAGVSIQEGAMRAGA